MLCISNGNLYYFQFISTVYLVYKNKRVHKMYSFVYNFRMHFRSEKNVNNISKKRKHKANIC